MVIKTPFLIEQHIHGAFGVDFNKAGADDILVVAEKLREHGIAFFFPTLVTDSVENIKRQIAVLKKLRGGVILFWVFILRGFL